MTGTSTFRCRVLLCVYDTGSWHVIYSGNAMNSAAITTKAKQQVPTIARLGLVAKGFVYLLLGTFVMMSALNIKKVSDTSSKTGVLKELNDSIAGHWLLLLLAVGLVCYAGWRYYQVYHLGNNAQQKWKKMVRYFFSGSIYLFIGYTAIQIFLDTHKENGNNEQHLAAALLSKPFGQWMLGIAALVIAGVGIYQIIYGLSGKYKNHDQNMALHTAKGKILLTAGKIGYPARGIVWMIIAYLMLKAALSKSSSEAGDTSKAFDFVESAWGSPILALIAAGLVAYGLFNFIRARYEQSETMV